MTSTLALVERITPAPAQRDARLEEWRTYLAGRIDPDWHPEEWDMALWLFTGDVDNPAPSPTGAAPRVPAGECCTQHEV
ncbi:hypothetical protein NKH18_42590 [Streptomyces sp. M10(2022)]